jgi:hypothetical protein
MAKTGQRIRSPLAVDERSHDENPARASSGKFWRRVRPNEHNELRHNAPVSVRESLMSWPSTPCDILRDIYGSSKAAMRDSRNKRQTDARVDIPDYDPVRAQPLDAGMALQLNFPGYKCTYFLTDKGKDAAEMLLCNRTFGRFPVPDWLMAEITGQTSL